MTKTNMKKMYQEPNTSVQDVELIGCIMGATQSVSDKPIEGIDEDIFV